MRPISSCQLFFIGFLVLAPLPVEQVFLQYSLPQFSRKLYITIANEQWSPPFCPDFQNLVITPHVNPKSIKVGKLFLSRNESKIHKIVGKVYTFNPIANGQRKLYKKLAGA